MMKKFILLQLLLLLVVGVYAQRPNYLKLSPLVREAVTEVIVETRKAPSITRNPENRTLTAFAKFSNDAEKTIQNFGCEVLAKVGNVYILSIPLDKIAALSNQQNVLRIEAGRSNEVQMDTTKQFINALQVYEGRQLPQKYTGKGVVVGVQDVGFDLTHPTFYSADMSEYRIKALWDQLSTDTLNTSLPVGRDYHSQQELMKIGRSFDGLIETHGTHTAGIAAGSGAEGDAKVSPYRGMAYESDIVMVANAVGSNIQLIDKKNYYKYTYATDALGFKYIFDYADRQNKPCVINFSEGGHEDFQGYDQLYYEMLDKLVGPGHIIVASAGNSADWVNYINKPKGVESSGAFVLGGKERASFTLKSDQPFTFRFAVYADRTNPFFFEIPTQKIVESKDFLLEDSIVIGKQKYIYRMLAYRSSYNSNEMAYDIMLISKPDLGHNVPLSLEIVGVDAAVNLYRLSGYLLPNELNPQLKAGDNSHSVHSPSSARRVISVGATAYRRGFYNYLGVWKDYNKGTDGRRTSFSSVGPTLDGRTKPDVMAPGQNIISAYSSFFINNPDNVGELGSDVKHFSFNGKTYAWNSNGGTSMSSPIIAGAIALWLQAYPRLTPEDCFDVFSKTCTHYDASLSYPNNLYGYGQIDVYEGLKEVLKKAAAGIEQVEDTLTLHNDNKIYYLDGRFAGTNENLLPCGIYIRNHKKFIKR